jgi:hypothetical protein
VSSTTWTPHAVASEARRRTRRLWRAVEAQHVASTTRLVDGLAEQALLEEILEKSKPALPEELRGLHYLLATPFRYPPLARGSRFRSPLDPGVFYGARERRSACAELGYWRWRFLRDSPGLASIGPVAQTVFQAAVEASAVDLRQEPLARDVRAWTDPESYEATQAFARAAREAQVGLILYQSVRDPRHGECGALLTPRGFASPRRPIVAQTWFLTVTGASSAWQRDGERFEFAWSGQSSSATD